MEDGPPGTVTSLSSIFPAEEAERAAKRVEEAISEKQKELERIRGFISDNNDVINLVQKLPEELHHDIMVPFGKAAFFPGRLVHTNEFMVLLGEGHYAERTSKQTVDILRRREKALESHVNSLNVNIDELKAEASFFSRTASESAEGLVEIHEKIPSSDDESESGSNDQDSVNSSKGDKGKVPDDEYARIMSRLDELEEEELAEERADESDEEDEVGQISDSIPDGSLSNQNVVESELTQKILPSQSADGHTTSQILYHKQLRPDTCDQVIIDKLNIEAAYKDKLPHGQNPEHEHKIYRATEKTPPVVGSKEVKKVSFKEGDKAAEKAPTLASMEEKAQFVKSSNTEVPVERQKPIHDSVKAFTGSIVERPPIINPNRSQNSATSLEGSLSSQPSKPVSRFKLQRR